MPLKKRSKVGVLSKKTTHSRSQTMKKVSRKAVIPSPAPDVSAKWRVGDLFEVFNKSSWKIAVLCKVLGKTYCLVRLVGSSSQFKVSKAKIRERKLRRHGIWDSTLKDCCDWDDVEDNESSNVKYNKKQRSQPISTNLGSNHAHNVTCSAGSCSVASNDLNEFPLHSSRDQVKNIGCECSYVESAFHMENEREEENLHVPTKEELEVEIHSLELHAYCCTMEALHASGPLSWEKEELITNLRVSLHISNDEHLSEIRSLISSNTSIPIR